ncbi:unnamed protein product [Gemmataceae bacterium]|nr:unnamed protein product [Gemmataceae bacterium]VTT96533.1 unnamed protein product [Gemmataceae bacterium]
MEVFEVQGRHVAGAVPPVRRRGPAAGRHPAVVHVCGACKTCHYQAGEGLRPLTPAELLDLHVALPKTMDRIERSVFPSVSRPHGTLIFGTE